MTSINTEAIVLYCSTQYLQCNSLSMKKKKSLQMSFSFLFPFRRDNAIPSFRGIEPSSL